MDSNLVITIGRTFGSGGREIGKALAAELGMKYYDKEILAEAAKESEIDSLHAAVLTGGMNPHPHRSQEAVCYRIDNCRTTGVPFRRVTRISTEGGNVFQEQQVSLTPSQLLPKEALRPFSVNTGFYLQKGHPFGCPILCAAEIVLANSCLSGI